MIGVEFVISNRVEMLKRLDPEMTIRMGVDRDGWGLITLWKGPWFLGAEVVESTASWLRHGSSVRYSRLRSHGRYLGVIVPEDIYCSLVRVVEDDSITMLSYDRLGNINPPIALVVTP